MPRRRPAGARYHFCVRRPILLVAGVVMSAIAALLGAAWLAVPAPVDLGARLAVREHATGGERAVPLQRIAPVMREAIVATEDERFYSNHGIDLLGIARAIPYDIAHLSFAQGASTITDQLAKLLYLNGNDHSPWRKLEDLALALKISTRYSKEAVLDDYLNSAYFGHGAYGIRAAAKTFFATTPSRLDLAQASLLAGLVQAPSAYDPLNHPLAARERQLQVLRSLVRGGYATASAGTRVAARPLPLRAGHQLPPLAGAVVTSQPAFAPTRLLLGVALIAAAVAAFLALRHKAPLRRHGVQVALRWACLLVALAGAVTVTNSLTL